MGKFSQKTITRSNIISITGAGMYEIDGTVIGPVQKGGTGNCLVSSTSGEYDGGDRVIGFHSGYDIDGDILITVGWGDGCAVRRLNNDGSMTRLYYDSNALWRDTTSTYNHLQSVAMAKGVNKAVIGTYNVYGYSIIDYRGAVDGTTNGGAVIREDRPTHTNPTDFVDDSGTNSRANGYIRRYGSSYYGALCAAGEWIYASSHDANTHYKKYGRRNLATGAQEFISGVTDKKAGTADEDRNGYRAFLSYDEVNDRMYYFNFEGNGAFTVILDASTASPEAVWCDLEDTIAGTNSVFSMNGYSREQGLYIPDPVNAPNVIIMGGYDYIMEVNFTPCLTGGVPNVTKRAYNRNYTEGHDHPANMRMGTKFQKSTGTPMDKLPDYADSFCGYYADRGYGKVDGGFVDMDNFKIYSRKSMSDYVEDQASVYGGSARGRSFQSDYAVNPVLMSSANGTKYWIRMGYGSDGHSFRIWSEATKPLEYIGNWEIVFGTFTLDNSANVDMVFLGGMSNFIIPSNCTLNVYVSNDNGETFESYDRATVESHVFGTTGTQLRIKIVATGHPNKAPFYTSRAGLTADFGSLHDAAKHSNIKFKVTRKRLR
jgi:hypothetical protein